jgi:hypothetical protein
LERYEIGVDKNVWKFDEFFVGCSEQEKKWFTVARGKMVYDFNEYKACSQSCPCCTDWCIKVFLGVLPLTKHFWQNSHIRP